MGARAVIFGCEGHRLSARQKQFFANANPWGFILFARNVDTPDQLRALTAELRQTVGRNAPILIDQEGGRVARLKPPHWREWLPALDQMDTVAPKHQYQAMALRYRLIAMELRDVGIDVNCAPMLDIAFPQSHEIITNRCYGRDVGSVAKAGRAVAEGLMSGGVLPIIKHIPGHGRSSLDSHFELPRVETPQAQLRETDFIPFMRLSDLPMAMTAHIIYLALDSERCATLSPDVIGMIRKEFGFDGLLITDDLSMKALSGSFEDRTRAALAAGCDVVLHCNGDAEEMAKILSEVPELIHKAASRAQAALALRIDPEPFDTDWADGKLTHFLKGAVYA